MIIMTILFVLLTCYCFYLDGKLDNQQKINGKLDNQQKINEQRFQELKKEIRKKEDNKKVKEMKYLEIYKNVMIYVLNHLDENEFEFKPNYLFYDEDTINEFVEKNKTITINDLTFEVSIKYIETPYVFQTLINYDLIKIIKLKKKQYDM